jgi:hypothetical protein
VGYITFFCASLKLQIRPFSSGFARIRTLQSDVIRFTRRIFFNCLHKTLLTTAHRNEAFPQLTQPSVRPTRPPGVILILSSSDGGNLRQHHATVQGSVNSKLLHYICDNTHRMAQTFNVLPLTSTDFCTTLCLTI